MAYGKYSRQIPSPQSVSSGQSLAVPAHRVQPRRGSPLSQFNLIWNPTSFSTWSSISVSDVFRSILYRRMLGYLNVRICDKKLIKYFHDVHESDLEKVLKATSSLSMCQRPTHVGLNFILGWVLCHVAFYADAFRFQKACRNVMLTLITFKTFKNFSDMSF